MDLLLIFFGSFILAFSGAIMPGPMLTVTIAQSVKKGFITGPLIVLGHMFLEIALLIMIVLGFNKFIQQPFVMKIIFLAGGAILIAMGCDLILNFKKSHIKKEASSKNLLSSNLVITGILVSLSNPYWTLWWITIGLGYVIKAMEYKFIGLLFFFSGHILADLAWYSFISFSFSKGKKFINDTAYHIIIVLCGIFLILYGIWFLFSGII